MIGSRHSLASSTFFLVQHGALCVCVSFTDTYEMTLMISAQSVPKTSHPSFDNDPQCSVKKTEEGGLEKHLWDLPHIEHHQSTTTRVNRQISHSVTASLSLEIMALKV